jgi:hypothetical protein
MIDTAEKAIRHMRWLIEKRKVPESEWPELLNKIDAATERLEKLHAASDQEIEQNERSREQRRDSKPDPEQSQRRREIDAAWFEHRGEPRRWHSNSTT